MAAILTDYLEARNALLYVMSEDGRCKGWRVDLLVEKLSSKVEEKLLLCSCCHGLLRDACLYEEELRCGVCIPEGATWQPEKMNRNIVYEKMIYCPLKWRGCGWSDTLSTAVHHLEDCLYIPELCPLGCVSLEWEVVRMERRHIPEHVRDCCPLREVMCEFCAGEVKACEMNPHLEVCEEFFLLCPNCCSSEGEDGVTAVMRKDLPVHLDNHCPLQIVQCPYWDHGCREKMERRLTDVHEREFMHIHLKLSLTEMKQSQVESNIKIAILEKELSEVKRKSNEKIEILERQMSDKDERIQTLSEILFSYFQSQFPTGKLEWNVKEVKQKIHTKEETYSDPFYVGLYKCQCRILWDYNNAGMFAVIIRIMKGDFDEKLHWPIRYRFTFVLVNQINCHNNLVKSDKVTKEEFEKYPECSKRPTEYRNEKGFGQEFISNTEILEEKYCKQDSITLHVSIELLPHII